MRPRRATCRGRRYHAGHRLPPNPPRAMPETTIPPAHQLTMTVLMTPDMANFSGNVHGGSILKLLDQVAYACASR